MYYAALYCIENVHYTEFRANDASANIIVRGAQQITRSDTLAIRTLVWQPVVRHNVNQSELFTPLCTFMYQTFGLHIMLLHCFDISSFTRSTGSLLRYQCNYIISWTPFKSFRQQTYSPKTRIKNTRILNSWHCNHAMYITPQNKLESHPRICWMIPACLILLGGA